MSDKVKLPRFTINVIETIRAKGLTNEEIVINHINNDQIKVNGYEAVDDLNTDELIRALYLGYECEVTMEDKLLDEYQNGASNLCGGEVKALFQYGMERALKIAGIKVKGVNA